MDIHELKTWPREERGTRQCRRLRERGLVPAILYGRGKPNLLLAVRDSDLEKTLQDRNFIVRLLWDSEDENVQISDVALDHLGDTILHVDFTRISLTEQVTVSVPLRVRGEPQMGEEGGVLDTLMHEIEVECLPTEIPDEITVDVSGLGLHDSLRVQDLDLPEGVTATADPEGTVVAFIPTETMEEEEEEPEEMVLEPELIGREEAEAGEKVEAEAPKEEAPPEK